MVNKAVRLRTQVQSRKERRKDKRKRNHGQKDEILEYQEEQQPPRKRISEGKNVIVKKHEHQKVDDVYGHMDPDAAAALRRDDDEIADLEMKLGLSKNKKGRDKLNREYARLEGYGDDFGNFLDDLDDMVVRISSAGGNNESDEEVNIKRKEKKPKDTKVDDPYANFGSAVAAAMRRDDDEIKELEQKLGLKKKKDKSKLHKEYAKLEGYGDDFGAFLDDLDDMVLRVTDPAEEDHYDQRIEDSKSINNESSDDEKIEPMKEPFEALDEDDSVLEELEKEEQMKFDNEKSDNSEEELDSGTSESEVPVGHLDKFPAGSESEDACDDDSQSSNEIEPDHNIADTYTPSAGEDIYGNKFDNLGDGTPKPKKYVPPHLRKSQTDDEGQKERLRLIQRSLNNAMNRLSEDTLISVAQQVSKLFKEFPTQMVQEMMWKNTKDACVLPPMLMNGLIPVYVACIVGTHVQTGDTVQIGEYILERVIAELWRELKSSRIKKEASNTTYVVEDIEKKMICNLMLLLCYLYNYSIVHCSFIYDIIRHLIEMFSEADIECLLLLLRHCGRSLRSDDPLALKEIVLLVQKKKSEDSKLGSNSRAEYMLSAIMDLKNNKQRKQDDVYTEKTSKLRSLLGRIKSSAKSTKKSESSLRISLQDILDADTKGRWWKVGASWVGNQYHFSEDGNDSKESGPQTKASDSKNAGENETLLKLAVKYRMNTDRKRSIFCIIMSGEDCEDVFEKLCRSSMLQNRSERDTVRVLMECCGNEKSYNKFYGHLAHRICEYQPQCKFSLQLAYWDAFKQFDSMGVRKAANLARLLFHTAVALQSLKLMPVMKALEIDEDLDEAGVIFLTILLTDVLGYYDDPSLAKAQFVSSSGKRSNEEHADQEEGFRASLLLFLMETLKASPKNKKGSKFRKNFKAVVKSLDTDGFESMF
jgi:nucleolar MIF4G domain-containing protein 1